MGINPDKPTYRENAAFDKSISQEKSQPLDNKELPAQVIQSVLTNLRGNTPLKAKLQSFRAFVDTSPSLPEEQLNQLIREAASVIEASNAVSSLSLDFLDDEEDLPSLLKRVGEIAEKIEDVFGKENAVGQAVKARLTQLLSGEDEYKFISIFHSMRISNKGVVDNSIKEMIKSYPDNFLSYISLVRKDDEPVPVEWIEYLANTNPVVFLRHLNDFNLKDQNVLVGLARLVLKKSSSTFSSHIQQFKIQDERARQELFQEVLSQLGWNFSAALIKNFEISNQEFLIKNARELAEINPGILAECFRDFPIEDGSIRVELARKIVKKNPSELARHLRDFKIPRREIRVQLAEAILRADPVALAESIDQFEIDDPEKLIEFAEVVLEKKPIFLMDNLEKFGINDESFLVKCAKKIAEIDHSILVKKIKKFKISNGEKRLEIAQEVFRNNPAALAQNIDQFEIDDQKKLVEFAEGVLAINPLLLLSHINKFGIRDELILARLARRIAENEPSQLITFIDNFGLKNQEILADVFKYSISCLPDGQTINFHTFIKKIKDTQLVDEQKLAEVLIALLDRSFSSKFMGFDTEALRQLTHYPSSKPFIAWISSRLLAGGLSKVVEGFETLVKKETAHPLAVWEQGILVLRLMSICEASNIPSNELAQEIIALLKVHFPALRQKIAAQLNQQLLNFSSSISWLRRLKALKKEAPSYLALPLAYLAMLEGEGNEEVKLISRRLLPELKRASDNGTPFFKDASSIQALLQALVILVSNSKLTFDEKMSLLEVVLKSKNRSDIVEGLRVIQVVENLPEGGLSLLKGKKSLQELKDTLFNAFQALVPVGQMSNFWEKFEATIGRFRNPTALLVYAGTMMTLPKGEREILLEKIGVFAREVLLGTFRTSRYENSEHLDRIFKSRPELKEAWRKGWEEPLTLDAEKQKSKKYKDWKIVDSDDPCDLLLCGTEVEGSCQRVNGASALNKCLLAYLLDGKNRVLAIKDEMGAIKARAILRLLWSEKGPVLFLERSYPASVRIGGEPFEGQLIEAAIKKAKALNLELCTMGGQMRYRGHEIRSLGGPAPFEYVDSSGGVRKDSIWSIPSYVGSLYSPPVAI